MEKQVSDFEETLQEAFHELVEKSGAAHTSMIETMELRIKRRKDARAAGEG